MASWPRGHTVVALVAHAREGDREEIARIGVDVSAKGCREGEAIIGASV